MTDSDTTVEIELDEDDIARLKDGETVEVVMFETENREDRLEVSWHTVIESEGAEDLHEELADLF